VSAKEFSKFWVVTPCIVAVGYQRFTSPWRWRQQVPPKFWYPTATLHDPNFNVH